MDLKHLLLFFLMLSPTIGAAAPVQDCSIRLEFFSNETGAVASYVLTLQAKNTTGRLVRGLSVNYFDSNFSHLGNTQMTCSGTTGEGITPGSYGECITQLQKVDGNLLTQFGGEMWTAIVNTQLVKLESIKKCEVIGFAY